MFCFVMISVKPAFISNLREINTRGLMLDGLCSQVIFFFKSTEGQINEAFIYNCVLITRGL